MLRPTAIVAVAVALVLGACGGDDVPPADGSSGTSGATSGSSGTSGATSGSSGTSGTSGTDPGTPFSTAQKDGIATFYDADGAGAWNCSFPVEAPLDITALNFPEYAKSNACGACFLVTGPKGQVTVRVVDSCPGCKEGHLDLSEQAFEKIADRVAGRVDITYQGVACAVTGNLSYHFKEGSSKYWTAIQVRNHRLPITKVEYKKNGAYVAMPRSDYNYFIDAKGVGDQPGGLAIRVTAVDGQTIEDALPGVVESDKLFPGKVQFK